MTGIHIDDEQLKSVKNQVSALATSIDQIAHGAYITQTMFTQTQAASAAAMDDVLHVLVNAADTMFQCAQGLANYLGTILDEYNATDLSLTQHVNTATR
jgi:hypothetical protein